MAVQELARDLLAEVARDRKLCFYLLDLGGGILFSTGRRKERFEVVGDVVVARRLGPGRELVWYPVLRGQSTAFYLGATYPKAERTGLEKLIAALRSMLEHACEQEYENDNMTQNLVQVFEEVSTFMELSKDLPGCGDVRQMAEMALARLCVATGSRRGLFALCDARQAQYRILVQAASHREGPLVPLLLPEDCQYPLSEGLIGLCIRECRGMYLNQLQSPGTPLTEAELLAARNLLVVPMPFATAQGNQVLGALCLMDREEEAGYESPQIRLAEAIAVLMASLLGTMKAAELRKELEVGRTIQNALLPERAPQIPGFDAAGKYRQATHVGGDYFDFIPAGDATYAVIADVSGHNLASGMMMVMARTLLRSIAAKDQGPGAILNELAHSLFPDLVRNERFITLFVVRLQRGSHEIRYASAGHNPPLLWRSAARGFEPLETDGSVVGMVPSQEFEERRTHMAPGDILTLYTDGITEATSAEDEMFGDGGLRAVVAQVAGKAASTVLDHIFRAVGEFAEGEGDDLTAVVLKAV